MPWDETDPTDEMMQFVVAMRTGDISMTEACTRFAISRRRRYEVEKGYAEVGLGDLCDRSRAPHSHPNQAASPVEAAVHRVRMVQPTWRLKHSFAELDPDQPDEAWPARITVDTNPDRAGGVLPRAKRARRKSSCPPMVEANAANDAWSIGNKGWFCIGDGTRCDPLTVSDMLSRNSLVCRAMVSPKSSDRKL